MPHICPFFTRFCSHANERDYVFLSHCSLKKVGVLISLNVLEIMKLWEVKQLTCEEDSLHTFLGQYLKKCN